MHYLNKKELRDLLAEYQEISEDIDDSWLKKYKRSPRRKLNAEQLKKFKEVREDFKKYRYAQYAAKRARFEAETPEERKARIERADKVKELIARDFFKIIDGVILLYEFQANTDFTLKDDMRSEAIWTMYNYINKYDVRRPNPFSYFTEMAKNAFRQVRDDDKLRKKRNVSADFIENLDDDYKESEWYE